MFVTQTAGSWGCATSRLPFIVIMLTLTEFYYVYRLPMLFNIGNWPVGCWEECWGSERLVPAQWLEEPKYTRHTSVLLSLRHSTLLWTDGSLVSQFGHLYVHLALNLMNRGELANNSNKCVLCAKNYWVPHDNLKIKRPSKVRSNMHLSEINNSYWEALIQLEAQLVFRLGDKGLRYL